MSLLLWILICLNGEALRPSRATRNLVVIYEDPFVLDVFLSRLLYSGAIGFPFLSHSHLSDKPRETFSAPSRVSKGEAISSCHVFL